MQKSGVKTLSIIDTISELAQNENEASRLTLPSPISGSPANRSPVKKKFSSPVVSITSSTRSAAGAASVVSGSGGGGVGARPKFNSADAVEAVKTSSPLKDSLCNNLANVDRLNLSAIASHSPHNAFTPFVTLNANADTKQNKVQQTPDWIREIFLQAKRGNLDFLVKDRVCIIRNTLYSPDDLFSYRSRVLMTWSQL